MKSSNTGVCRALSDYEANDGKEMTLKKGEVLILENRWKVQRPGNPNNEGLVPKEHLERVNYQFLFRALRPANGNNELLLNKLAS